MSGSWPLGSHRDAPVELEADQEVVGYQADQLLDRARSLGQNYFVSGSQHRNKPIIIKDEDDDAEREIELKIEEELMGYIDLTADDHPQEVHPQEVPARPVRNGSLDATHISVNTYTLTENIEVKIGTLVELSQVAGPFKASFLRIVSIYMPLNGERSDVIFRGALCTRTRYLGGQLPRKLNEMCLIYQVDKDDARDYQVQALFEVRPDDIAPIHPRHFKITNKPFPEGRFEQGLYGEAEQVEEQGLLVCRWKYIISYADEAKRTANRPCEWAFFHITEFEVDKSRNRITEKVRLNRWRGGKVPGGSYTPEGILLPPPVHIDDEQKEGEASSTGMHKRITGQRYVVADTFSGGGGFSRGAQMAGIHIKLAVDHWSRACATYRKNFDRYGVKMHEMDVFDFLNEVDLPHALDMLHMSPACQPYSPAHTVEGKDDEKNIAVLYSCTELVKKIRPRIFTLEQTFGLLHNRHKCFFNALVQGFTCHGYSVRWKVVNLTTLGLSQARRRLIMIGACPGEPLPDFPPATHSSEPVDGLLPYVSVRQVLDRIHPACTLHDLDGVSRRDERPWDADGILPRTITTSGGQNYHYSGTRDLTYREYASLQGFPVWHRFVAPGIKKQIGNAFPPCVVKVLYDWLRKWLESVDGVEPAPPPEPEDLVDLTLDDDDDDESLTLGDTPVCPLKMGQVKDETKQQKCLNDEEVQLLNETEATALAIKASLASSQNTAGSLPQQDDNKCDDFEVARRESLQLHFQGAMGYKEALERARRQSVMCMGERRKQRSIVILDDDDEQMDIVNKNTNVPMCVDGGQRQGCGSISRQHLVNKSAREDSLAAPQMVNSEELMDSDASSVTIGYGSDMDLDD